MTFIEITYCASPNCKNECGRKLTAEIERAAKRSGQLLSMAYFCEDGNESIRRTQADDS